MTGLTEPAPLALDDVFRILADRASEATSRGTVLHAPQAKSFLKQASVQFDEGQYGFKKFVDLLRAGEQHGSYQLRLVDGHPQLTSDTPPPSPSLENAWLQPDLWTTLLTWEHGKRYWDLRRHRATFVPTDEHGSELWSVTPNDFVAIKPVTLEEQLAWMRDFAQKQSEPANHALQKSLDDETPGAFKRALLRLHLQPAWTSELRRKVAEHAADWAAANDIAVSSILEHRSRPITAKSVNAAKPSAAATSRPSSTEELRSKLHSIIDEMSFADLAALPIPAGYLIRR